ncbi:MAG: DEAD/DEAH box helicase [Nitrospira sp.]|nr:DEAD/DEAH box helicase [Nitrospira sp.]
MLRLIWDGIETTLRPDQVVLQPFIDFDSRSGALKIALHGDLNGKPICVSRPSLARGGGTFKGRRFIINPYGLDVIQSIGASCEWADDGTLCCTGDNVPGCLASLRKWFRVEQTPAASAVTIHPAPLEHRTYVDLEDPDTLLVRQTLTTADGSVIPLPTFALEEHPSWIGVANQFYKMPQERPYAPSQGTEVSPGTRRLVLDEVPEFLQKELSTIKASSRVLIDKEAGELRVVATTPKIHTSIDFDEGISKVVARPQYKYESESLDHADLQRADESRKYYRKWKIYYRVDWTQIHRVETALKDIGLEEQPDGSYCGPSFSYDEIIDSFSKLGILSESAAFTRFKQRLLDCSTIDSLELPENLRQGLSVRHYQHHGYEWLAFLKRYGLPGILADELGLGKTLQMLLTIAHVRKQDGRCPSLVVCPANLVETWADEADKFLSEFSALINSGENRNEALRVQGPHVDLVVTSYETMVRDVEDLRLIQWRFLIIDEAHKIKNPDTPRAKAVRTIPAEARVAITGIPIENTLQDLWSVFDFLAPGFLFSKGEFARRISNPIEHCGDRNALDLLRRKTRPFVLRRLKKDVAKELPDKIEKTVRCELTEKQRALYNAVVTRDLEEALNATSRETLTLGNPHIFSVLLKLKQICCHPGLVTGDFEEFKPGVSGKFDAFMEILEEILDSRATDLEPNKLVVFSQFVPMTTFLQHIILSKGRSCERIDDSVHPGERPARCRWFNSQPSQFGIVTTLFSGGVGLDLQSANYVAVYDQWWNPAVGSQAVDRVHRIGQRRTAVVFHILARGTLEDKIESKLLKKKNLFDLTIRPDQYLQKEITREELLDLVSLEN